MILRIVELQKEERKKDLYIEKPKSKISKAIDPRNSDHSLEKDGWGKK